MCKGQECPRKSSHGPKAKTFLRDAQSQRPQFDQGCFKQYWLSIPSCFFPIERGFLLGDKNGTIPWVDDVWRQQRSTCVQFFKVQIFRLATVNVLDFLFTICALWQTQDNSSVWIKMHVSWNSTPGDEFMKLLTQGWCDVSMEIDIKLLRLNDWSYKAA